MTMEDPEYEHIDSNNPLIHMTAGASAGIMEHISVYPIDLVKTRIQASFTPSKNAGFGVLQLFRSIIKNEGILSLYRGSVSVLIGAGPAHAAYFAIYEKSKFSMLQYLEPNKHEWVAHGIYLVILGASGVLATFAHDTVMTPIDVIKQRLQVCPRKYVGMCDCLKKIVTIEGVAALYRSFPVQLLINFPYHSSNFMVYEYMKKKMLNYGDYQLSAHLISGGISGVVASVVTTPLDVIKTTLNLQDPQAIEISRKCHGSDCSVHINSYKIKGIVEASRTIYTAGGVMGFFKGTFARILIAAPSCAISWSVYEAFKYFLSL